MKKSTLKKIKTADLLTDNEFEALKGIDKSEYGDWLSSEVWSFTIANNSSLSGRTVSGVVSSLAKKGYVRTSGCNKEDTVQMTNSGIEAYKAACDLRSTKPKKFANMDAYEASKKASKK